MKIQYLGTAAAEGIPAIFCECEACKKARKLGGKNIRTRSQAIIDDTLLIDFPADTYMHCLQYNIPLYKIKTCIITHSHSDHLYPTDVEMRKDAFAHTSSDEPLTFYADESGYKMLCGVIERYSISEKDARAVLIKPCETFFAEGYKITPIRATHDPSSTPVVYAIEKDGKSIFYAHDTSELCKESMDWLKTLSKPFDLVSLDCTQANDPEVPYVGHMNLKKCVLMRDEFISLGITDKNTVFVANHFSHNGANSVYDEFVKIAEKEGFLTSYDGMEIEF